MPKNTQPVKKEPEKKPVKKELAKKESVKKPEEKPEKKLEKKSEEKPKEIQKKKSVNKGDAPNKDTARAELYFNVKFAKKWLKNYYSRYTLTVKVRDVVDDEKKKKPAQDTAARKAKKMTQAAVAKKAAMPQSVIARLESGDHSVSVETLRRVAHALGKRVEIA